MTKALLLSACACVLAASAFAQDPSRPSGPPPGPPPEAIAACKGKAVGDAVSFTGRRGDTLTGTCQKHGDVLAARPDHPPGGGPRDGSAPPQR